MRRIAHISDLHFGHEDARVAAALLDDLKAQSPSIVAVSGDLTQRARRSEFAAARAFLDAIPFPKLVVPGNHDIPLHDVFSRAFRPLRRYREAICDDLTPTFLDDELAVVGVSSARSFTVKNGRISIQQIEAVRQNLCVAPAGVLKVVVTHHPFTPSTWDPKQALIGRGLRALRVLQGCGVDLLLNGHLHVGFTGDVRAHHVEIERSILIAHAGTCISTRGRGEPNSYNVIDADGPRLSFGVRGWNGARFVGTGAAHYLKKEGEWHLDESRAPLPTS